MVVKLLFKNEELSLESEMLNEWLGACVGESAKPESIDFDE
jgi:hypothetical protein